MNCTIPILLCLIINIQSYGESTTEVVVSPETEARLLAQMQTAVSAGKITPAQFETLKLGFKKYHEQQNNGTANLTPKQQLELEEAMAASKNTPEYKRAMAQIDQDKIDEKRLMNDPLGDQKDKKIAENTLIIAGLELEIKKLEHPEVDPDLNQKSQK